MCEERKQNVLNRTLQFVCVCVCVVLLDCYWMGSNKDQNILYSYLGSLKCGPKCQILYICDGAHSFEAFYNLQDSIGF